MPALPAKKEIQSETLLAAIATSVMRLSRTHKIEKPFMTSFAAIYAAGVNPDEVSADDVEGFAASCLSLLQSAATRKPKQVIIDIIKPNDKRALRSDITLINIINPDRPFLVDSTNNELMRLGLAVERVIHPTAEIERDNGGNIEKISESSHLNGGKRESFIQFFISTPPTEIDEKHIKSCILRVLDDVRLAVDDWHDMRGKLAKIIGELPAGLPTPAEREEARRFLEWLDQDHFTFLGYRAYDYPKKNDYNLQVIASSGLGVIKDPEVRIFGDLRDLEKGSPEIQEFLNDDALIAVRKSNMLATVHRSVPMDVVSIKRYENGKAVGEHRFVGLFTSQAYNRNPRDIPLLRQKVENVIKRSKFIPSGHKAKTLVDVLVSFPRDELIQMSEDELYKTTMGITRLEGRKRTALFLRRDRFDRFISCLIFTPRDEFSTELREKFAKILESKLNGRTKNFYTQVTDSHLARVHFILETRRGLIPDYNVKDIERLLTDAARGFRDKLQEALTQSFGAGKTPALLAKYEYAFPASYESIYTATNAVEDIVQIEPLLAGKTRLANLVAYFYPAGDAAAGQCGLRLYHRNAQLALSDILPTLENMGFRVLNELPLPLRPQGKDENALIWRHDIFLIRNDRQPIDIDKIRDIAIEAIYGISNSDYEDDGFNRLVVTNQMAAREITFFRAYAKYLKQLGFTISQSFIEATLAQHAGITNLLRDLFFTKFYPALPAKQREKIAAIVTEIEQSLTRVTNADQDRILRRYLNLLSATLRTNYFQKNAAGQSKPYLSFKFDSLKIEEMPEPKMWREIFVCSPRVEAIHLRSGKVARGGIRWSDRRDDFRTEVLGLVKAQIVKNTVIVPVGSKGGFFVKKPPQDKKQLPAEVTDCYKTMMRGLLDITDNLKGNKVIPPKDVVRYDQDDPYLVVAADKGTAKFSDTANSVSAEYDFWLGDAFASGGSNGYDHKEMAITARGGWEAVKRHFREAQIDIRKTEFTAIGVGDMAGDVFGNGMLQSDKMRLIAAFNHNHIFIDPTPDAAKSFAERKRLFDNPQLTWADYNAKSISKGGGVYARDAKSIAITPEMRTALDIKDNQLTPAQLMQAILKTPADLLWLGGIGTFIKATTENHVEVGDRSNDALRINAKELRAKIVGEGANLGFTQRGRVEFALANGRINTDAIDNSAGVDTSDHEVNIKILLSSILSRGALTLPARNKLLKDMTQQVAKLVLRDNYEQSLALSFMQASATDLLEQHAHLIHTLERSGRLNRALEYLPTDAQIAERQRAKLGMTRPELAVLLAYSKMAVYEDLLLSNVPDEEFLKSDLSAYFPDALQKYEKDIESHALRREIIATSLINNMINRMGATFAFEVSAATGFTLSDVTRAYVMVRESFALEQLWAAINDLDGKVASQIQIKMIHALQRFVERATTWFLRQRKSKQSIADMLDLYGTAIAKIADNVADLLPKEDLEILNRKIKAYADQSVPKSLAGDVVYSRMYSGIGDVINISSDTKQSPTSVAKLYFEIGNRFGLDYMRRLASKISTDSAWQNRALQSIIDDLMGLQARLTKDVARGYGANEKAFKEWKEDKQKQIKNFDVLLVEIIKAERAQPAMLTVAIAQIRTLLV